MKSAALQHAQKNQSMLTSLRGKGEEKVLHDTNEPEAVSLISPGFSFGNIAVHDSALKIQPKLKINEPNDIYEQEADAIADKVMRMSDTDVVPSSYSTSDKTIQRKCAACEKEEEEKGRLQRKETNSAPVSSSYAPSLVHEVLKSSSGKPMDKCTRSFMESRFNRDFKNVKIHDDAVAAKSAESINARAYTSGNNIVFNNSQYATHSESGKKLLAHELTHVVQQKSLLNHNPHSIQREMKFELQTKNKIWRNDGVNPPTLLDRKYGPDDFLVKGLSTGVRLESESHGVLEFETEWFRKWSKLQAQLDEAFRMTDEINKAPAAPGGSGRKIFPFLNISHLQTGTKAEMKKGEWKRRKGKEGEHEKILRTGETLEVEITDSSWNAGIQSSEGFYLSQYESFLKQHESPSFSTPVIAHSRDIVNVANTGSIPLVNLENLLNFLEIIVNYIMRGQSGTIAGSSIDLKGQASKQAFALMNRTNFASIYKILLRPDEQKLFKKIVNNKIIITKMGLTKKTLFFIHGYGLSQHHRGDTVNNWLVNITKGVDLLSGESGKGLSAAMGKYNVEEKPGKDDTRLVKFETRSMPTSAWRTAANWKSFAEDLFIIAANCRQRPGYTYIYTIPNSTDLDYDGAKSFTGTCP